MRRNLATFLHRTAALAAFALAAVVPSGALAQTKWVATWATSPEPLVSGQSGFNPPSIGLSNNSVRQVLRASIGGDTLRMRFSNEYTNVPVKINAATIAVSVWTGNADTTGIIDTNTTRFFKFNGNDSVTMPANAYVWSDPIAFNLAPGAQVQVTIHFGAGVPAAGTYPGVTVHRGSRTRPRVLAGNQTTARTTPGAANTSQGQGSWVISSMEVRAPQSAGAVAILGNSITDGFGVVNGTFTRWTDALTTRLLANAGTSKVGVLNGGIGAGCMMSGCGVSTPGIQRYKRDLFDHAGVKWIIVLLGVNDLDAVNSSSNVNSVANNLIGAYTQIADSAHARGIKVYGATITPFNGNSQYYNASSEASRSIINAWVRTTAITSGKYDAVIDFDKLIRNPSDTTRILTTYNNDGLHPNIAGYTFMGNSIDTNLFIDGSVSIKPGAGSVAGHALEGVRFAGPGRASIRFAVPRETVASFKVHTTGGKEVAAIAGRAYAAGGHAVEFDASGLAGGVYLVSMRAAGFTTVRTMALTGR